MESIDVANVHSRGSGPVAILLPGWIGRGRDREGSPSQYRPLLGGALAKFGEIVAIDFKNGHVRTHDIAQEIASVVANYARTNGEVTVIGSSYGAMMVVYALGGMSPLANVRPVLIDPPAGAKSLVSLNTFRVVWLGPKIGIMPEWLNRGVFQRAFNAAFCGGMGKDDRIEVPSGTGDADAYIAQVRKDAYDGQQGFPAALCLEQIGAMSRSDGLPYAVACKMLDEGYGSRIVRIISTHNNGVVNPAVTDPFYNRHMPHATRVEALTNHVDYANRPQLWNKLLEGLL